MDREGRDKRRWRMSTICVAVGLCIVLVSLAVGIAVAIVNSDSIDKGIQKAMNPDRDYLILVNDKNQYEFGGKYDKALQNDLVYPPDVYGEVTPLEKATFVALSKLQQDLAEKGMIIGLYSGYRTKEDQQAVYDYYSNLEGWSETNKLALPGYSEHHTGLLVNIVIWYQGPEDEKPIWYTETAERQATIPDFKIVHETLANYGFIDRYPLGKEDITGVPSEPYEIRFVGSAKVAHAIMDNNLTLEEYLNKTEAE